MYEEDLDLDRDGVPSSASVTAPLLAPLGYSFSSLGLDLPFVEWGDNDLREPGVEGSDVYGEAGIGGRLVCSPFGRPRAVVPLD